MDYSIIVPYIPRRPEQILPYAGLVRWSNAERLWQGQSMMLESHHQLAFAAGVGFRVPTGIGVTLMPLRHPYEAATQARSVAMSSGQSVVAGFGPGAMSFQESLLGRPYRSQLGAVREYTAIVRGLLNGDAVSVSGEYFSCEGQLYPYPSPRVDVALGVLRPGMAHVAGEIADVAITWLTPDHYMRDVIIPAIRHGAAVAGRSMPRVTAIVPVALRRPDCASSELALAGSSAHLRLPHYVDMLRQAGITVEGKGSLQEGEALVDGGAFLSGDIDELVGQLRAYEDLGVDEVVLNVTGVFNLFGQQEALRELTTVLRAVA